MPPVVGVAVGVIVGDEEGEALAEAVGEGLAVDVSRGVGDCVGVGLGVPLGDGLALVAGSGSASAAVSTESSSAKLTLHVSGLMLFVILYGVIHHCGANFGIIVSRGGFSRGAIDFAKDKPILFLDVSDLIAMQEGRDVLAVAFSPSSSGTRS